MRILYLTDSYRPSRSACANRTVVLVDALREAGHDVQVLASSDSLLKASDDYVTPNYVTYFETFPLEEKTLVNRLKNNFGGQKASVKASRSMGDFDVVICTTPPLLLTTSAMKIACEKHARLVLDVRDIWPDVAFEMGSFTPRSPYGIFFSHIASKGFKSADLVVSVSPGKVEKLRKRVSSRDVLLVPNGIDEDFIEGDFDADIMSRYGIKAESETCVYVGNIGLAQGLGTLLDIAKKRPCVNFLLFGDGADKKTLEKRAQEENLSNVSFCGSVGAREVRSVLKSASLSFIPLVSSRLKDSIPTKLYESLACGCPVLLAAVGDSAALLDESGLGMHAAPEDQEGLLTCFDAILSRGYSSDERMRASRWVLENHSRQRFAQKLVYGVSNLETCDEH